MASTVVVEFDDWVTPAGADAWSPIPRFRLLDERGESLGVVTVFVSRTAEMLLLGQLGLTLEHGQHHEPVKRAVFRYTVRWIEQALRQGVLPPEDPDFAFRLDVSSDDVALLEELAGEKICEYQAAEGRDLFCLAAASSDATAVWMIEGRRASPTSRPICGACPVPDTDFLCSNLSHAEVLTVSTGPSYVKKFTGALCQAGRPEIAHRNLCRPDGNPCWQWHVDLSSAAAITSTPPLQLAEAVDYLDMAWRVTFGAGGRLLRSGGVADISALMLPASSREDFESRLSDLAVLLKRLAVPDEYLSDKDSTVPEDHTIERLRRALLERVQGADTDEVDRATRLLQAANSIRVGQQHPEAIRKTRESFELMGLTYPIDDWEAAWTTVRSAAADAILRLAHVVRRLEVVGDARAPSSATDPASSTEPSG